MRHNSSGYLTHTFLFCLITAILTGCDSCQRFHVMEGAVWNTTYTIRYSGDRNLDDSIMAVMNRIDMSLSPFNSNSLIARINSNHSMTVDKDIANIMAISQDINRVSAKAFDPTISPLINLWGFGYDGNDVKSFNDSVISSVLKTVGIDGCHIGPDMMIKKKSPSTTFNFSAVTKGYACDEIGRMLRRNGADNYMIEIGGEIALRGNNDRGKTWRIMIDAPIDSIAGHRRLTTVEITDCGIATSGNYRNFKNINGVHIGHTISTVTGRPIQTNTLSATVIAHDCAIADALATACMAMPPDSALSMIESYPGASSLLVTAENDGTIKITATSGFPEYN